MIESPVRTAALLAAAALVSGCAAAPSSSPGVPSAALQRGASGQQIVGGRLVGPGAILSDKFGGPIFGWSIDENATDGVLTEVSSLTDPYTSYVETFNQATAKIDKVVDKEGSGPNGDRELFVDGILANDVGLIDNERRNAEKHRLRDVWYVMSPVSGNKITGSWTRPSGKGFLIWDIADQQVDPDSVMAVTFDPILTRPPKFDVLVTNVANNTIVRTLQPPRLDGVNYPYFVAEDVATHHAYVPAANYHSQTVFIDFNVRTGGVSNRFVAPPFSGPVQGIAIDSATHMMCATTAQNYSVEMYDLTTEKQTFVGQVPNAGGELQAPNLVAADPVNHLFLVAQPQSLLGGSEIYVYDEKGNLVESLSGFQFIPNSGIQVVASTRTGYVAGPADNDLQSFSY